VPTFGTFVGGDGLEVTRRRLDVSGQRIDDRFGGTSESGLEDHLVLLGDKGAGRRDPARGRPTTVQPGRAVW
jgi:hypothetical protein